MRAEPLADAELDRPLDRRVVDRILEIQPVDASFEGERVVAQAGDANPGELETAGEALLAAHDRLELAIHPGDERRDQERAGDHLVAKLQRGLDREIRSEE